MNNNDRQLIKSLASDLKQSSAHVQKDLEADKLVQDEIASNPNALYQLTQAALIQKHAIEQLQLKMQGMQQHIQSLEYQNNQNQGGFFSKIFGGGNSNNRQAMTRQNQNRYNNQGQYGQNQYGQNQNQYGQNQGQYGQNQSPYGNQQQRGGVGGQSSFLGSALTTAAGVAGGMFLFQGINSLFDENPIDGAADAVTGAVDDVTGMGADAMQDMGVDSFADDASLMDSGFGDGDSDFFQDSGMSDFSGGGDDSGDDGWF